MNVFKHVITLAVIGSAVFICSPAHALWGYPVNPPKAPSLTKTTYLTNPNVGQIQAAIKPNTRIVVIGTVNASGGGRLRINVDDVRLSFNRAKLINWTGDDTWEGFVNISGSRVQVVDLRLNVGANSGRCRGITLQTPTSDVRINNCHFKGTADGLVADGEWERIAISNSSFINCGDFAHPSPDGPREGGYGMFFEDDDWNPDHLRISNVQVTLAPDAGQHGIRMSQVQNAIVEGSNIAATKKRAFWAYGVNQLAIRRSTFRNGSMLFSLMPHEHYTDRESRHVRIDSCRIEHNTILQPLGIYCSKGMRDFRFRDLDIVSTTSPNWLSLGWQTDALSQHIRWYEGTITFNGRTVVGRQWTSINDFTLQEQAQLKIGPMTP